MSLGVLPYFRHDLILKNCANNLGSFNRSVQPERMNQFTLSSLPISASVQLMILWVIVPYAHLLRLSVQTTILRDDESSSHQSWQRPLYKQEMQSTGSPSPQVVCSCHWHHWPRSGDPLFKCVNCGDMLATYIKAASPKAPFNEIPQEHLPVEKHPGLFL